MIGAFHHGPSLPDPQARTGWPPASVSLLLEGYRASPRNPQLPLPHHGIEAHVAPVASLPQRAPRVSPMQRCTQLTVEQMNEWESE